MTTQNAIFDAVQALIVRLDAEQKIIVPTWDAFAAVIRSHQNGPRPKGAYAMIQLLAEKDRPDHVCLDYRDIVTPDGPEPRAVETATRTKEFLFDVEVFAADALDRARVIAAALRVPAALTTFPYTVARVADPKFAPELVQQRWEGRARFQIEIAARVASETIVDLIDDVPVTALEGRGTSSDLVTTGAFVVARP